MDHYKKEEVRTRHKDHVKFVTEKPSRSPEQDLSKKAFEEKIQEVVANSLAKKCRQVFILSRVEGLSNGEIADIMKISKKNR